jgi:hypothetical protein
MKNEYKEEFNELLKQCKRNEHNGKFRVGDVIRLFEKTYCEQKEMIKAFRKELAKYQRK